MFTFRTQAHPDLKLWRQPWKPADGLRRKVAGDSGFATPFPSSPPEMGASEVDVLKSEVPSPIETHCSFQDSYISSDHCYQKPRTYYPAVERRLVVETRGGSELEDSLRSTEDLLEMAEQRYGASLDHEHHKLQLADRSFTKVCCVRMVCNVLSQAGFLKLRLSWRSSQSVLFFGNQCGLFKKNLLFLRLYLFNEQLFQCCTTISCD